MVRNPVLSWPVLFVTVRPNQRSSQLAPERHEHCTNSGKTALVSYNTLSSGHGYTWVDEKRMCSTSEPRPDPLFVVVRDNSIFLVMPVGEQHAITPQIVPIHIVRTHRTGRCLICFSNRARRGGKYDRTPQPRVHVMLAERFSQ